MLKTGVSKIVFGALLMGAPILVIGILFYSLFAELGADRDQFLVPGSMEVVVEEPSAYYLWHDHATIYNGVSYQQSPGFPNGASLSIVDSGGRSYEFIANGSISMSSGSYSRVSIGYVVVDEPVALTISVSGEFEERVLSFSKSAFWSVFLSMMGGILVGMVVGVAGLIFLVLGIVQQSRSRKRNESPTPGTLSQNSGDAVRPFD